MRSTHTSTSLASVFTSVQNSRGEENHEDDIRIDNRPTHEVWIVLSKNKPASVLVNLVRNIQVPEERRTEQAGDICVVHSIC